MLKYIKSEFYRILNKKGFCLYFIIPLVLAILSIIFMYLKKFQVPSEKIVYDFLIVCINDFISMSMFFVLPIYDICIVEDDKSHTLKNVVSYGIPRSTIVISKIVICSILGIIFIFYLLVLFLVTMAVVCKIPQTFLSSIITVFIPKLGVWIVIFVASASIATFLSMFFKSKITFVISYLMVLTVLSKRLVNFLTGLITDKLNFLGDIVLNDQITNILSASATNHTLIVASLVALGHIVAFSMIGIVYFKQKEVK
ncbi:ABC transporter permease [Clostridium oceanicum]|uniref:ABC transporter permease n=1 Tax=Clostridium oceanicum TaxID=1543 RepID=A0ABN1JD42_9CLOT